MEQLRPEVPKMVVNYPEPYAQISRAMNIHGVTDLGVVPKDKDRAASLDMDKDGRISRTLFVRSLDEEQLYKLHGLEKKLGQFVFDITGLKKHFRLDYSPTVLNEARTEAVADFNNSNRPVMRKEFGVTVPPYFPLDNEFDGMEYHHAWDKAVRVKDLDLPELKEKRRTAKSLLYD